MGNRNFSACPSCGSDKTGLFIDRCRKCGSFSCQGETCGGNGCPGCGSTDDSKFESVGEVVPSDDDASSDE